MIVFKFLHPEKAFAPIVLMFFPRTIFLSFVFFLNAFLLIPVTLKVYFPSVLLMVDGTLNVRFVFLIGLSNVTALLAAFPVFVTRYTAVFVRILSPIFGIRFCCVLLSLSIGVFTSDFVLIVAINSPDSSDNVKLPI